MRASREAAIYFRTARALKKPVERKREGGKEGGHITVGV